MGKVLDMEELTTTIIAVKVISKKEKGGSDRVGSIIRTNPVMQIVAVLIINALIAGHLGTQLLTVINSKLREKRRRILPTKISLCLVLLAINQLNFEFLPYFISAN